MVTKKQLKEQLKLQRLLTESYREMNRENLSFLSKIGRSSIPLLVSEYIKELSKLWLKESKKKVNTMQGLYDQAKVLDKIDAEILSLTELGFEVRK